MERVLKRLSPAARRAAGPSRTAALALRDDAFERADLENELRGRFTLSPRVAEHLITAWGADAVAVLDAAPEELRRPIGKSRYLLAEIPWSIRTECPPRSATCSNAACASRSSPKARACRNSRASPKSPPPPQAGTPNARAPKPSPTPLPSAAATRSSPPPVKPTAAA